VVIEVLGEDDETVIDLCAWPLNRPSTFGTVLGCDALGMARVVNPATWAFGEVLKIHKTPLDWIKAGCSGCCILNHRHAACWLREALGPIAVEDIEHARQLDAVLNLRQFPRPQILVPRAPERWAV
jgi:hypothetical protein